MSMKIGYTIMSIMGTVTDSDAYHEKRGIIYNSVFMSYSLFHCLKDVIAWNVA